MIAPECVVTYEEARRYCPGLTIARVPYYITPTALQMRMATIGAKPPETGDKGFGPVDRLGTDVVEFDERGSARARATVYSPDTAWGNERITFWEGQPASKQRRLNDNCHSHPGEHGVPSGDHGRGEGDLAYARLVLEVEPLRELLFCPILTGTGTKRVRLWPWVLTRESQGAFQYAECRVAEVSEFPRVGLRLVDEVQSDVIPLIPLDLEEVAASLGATITGAGHAWQFDVDGAAIQVSLTNGFPRNAPVVTIAGKSLPFQWHEQHRERVELRLARVLKASLRLFTRRF